jgi:signal transduction histidine kinase
LSRSGRSLRRRLLLTLAVVGLVQLLTVGLALAALLQLRQDQQRLTVDLFSTLQDSSAGFRTVIEIEEAARAYLTSGDQGALDRLQAAQAPRPGAVDADELERRLQDDPEALQALAQVRRAGAEWFSGLQPLIQAVQEQGPDAVDGTVLAEERRRFEQLNVAYDDYLDEVTQARDDAFERLQRSTNLLFAAVLLAVASALAAGVLLSVALRRWVTAPLEALGAETRTVREGDLQHEVSVNGPPEIAGLARDVDTMRRGLVSQLAEVERAQSLLEQQAGDLRRSNRDLEQFAYVASHDLQEPLRKVSSFCQMLQRRYHGQLDERADQYIDFAVDGAKRMQALINDLLAFSRVGRMSEGFTEVDLNDVLAQALRELDERVQETGAVLTADPLPVVTGERGLLLQLLLNLLGNALKFAGAAPPRVHVCAQRREDAWEIAVHDEGIGIDPRYAERIFVIFQRLHPKADYEGTGIGLALCKKIVEHHGGTIWLDAEPAETGGTGTTFRWTLPFEPPVREPAIEQQDDAPQGAREDRAWTTA